MTESNPLQAYFQQCCERVNQALATRVPAAGQLPVHLHQAMRYALLEGGKRIRPILVYATTEAFGAEPSRATPAACAVESIHAYSLVHDDLPAMDDDDLRRGKPTVHKAFDEATAILAGDALQTLAFEILAEGHPAIAADLKLRMIHILARASGSQGMAGGQAIDLAAVGKSLNLAELETMHLFKTGALIEASILLGALSAGIRDDQQLAPLRSFARAIGLAFQVQDDILDVESDTVTLGKQQGADAARDKPTYPALLGLDGAKQKARQLHDLALAELSSAGIPASRLAQICDYIIHRQF